jgi:hypothetical protein
MVAGGIGGTYVAVRAAIVEERGEGREMSGWSPAEAIAMERRHIAKGEERVAAFERYAAELAERGYESLLPKVNETLGFLRHSVDLSWERLQDLESRYGKLPRSN